MAAALRAHWRVTRFVPDETVDSHHPLQIKQQATSHWLVCIFSFYTLFFNQEYSLGRS
jgi:hypothetical protein